MRHSPGTSIVIVGQHALLRHGLAALFQRSPHKIIASARRASDLKEVRTASPLAILTIDGTVDSPAESETAENIHTLRERFTRARIVVVAETRASVDVRKIMALGPDAYIADLTSRELLLKVLDLLPFAQPVLVLSSDSTMAAPSEPPVPLEGFNGNGRSPTTALSDGCNRDGPLFSQRERQILCQLARGISNKEIARLFSITESTVKVHLKALLRKIGARNRTQAAIWAVGRGYLAPSPSPHPPLTQHAESSPRPNVIDPPGQRGIVQSRFQPSNLSCNLRG